MKNKYYLKIIVNSHSGTMSRLLSLFARRSISVDSINSGPEYKTDYVRIIFCVTSTYAQLETITHQIDKLIDTISVTLYDEHAKQVMTKIVRIKIKKSKQEQLIAQLFQQNIEVIERDETTMTICKTGTSEQIDAALSEIENFEIVELVNSSSTYII